MGGGGSKPEAKEVLKSIDQISRLNPFIKERFENYSTIPSFRYEYLLLFILVLLIIISWNK
jgi:hypothetical protein